ncbi:MAG: hypothetical protein DCC71_12190 [Proteobacteria bacterium]|nr:MAG: hypothetical protein DCC71_12190 [Pseudomonadota bacterium]
MQLYLQFGHGMIEHTKALLKSWGDGGVVLSPRDLTRDQIVNVGQAVTKLGREALLDPQCFAHDADHHRLMTHEHFKAFSACATTSLFTPQGARDVIKPLFALGVELGAQRHIVPGLLARPVSQDWVSMQTHLIAIAKEEAAGRPLLATVALSSDSVRAEADVEAVIEAAAKWTVEGFYVVAESPSVYLVDDPVWTANVLLLVSGLRLHKKPVLVGYSNHQLLCLAAAGADVMASGTWLNVRAFPIDKFYQPAEDEESRRTIWYYCPQSLSEYKLPFLDIAKRVGVLPLMKPDPAFGSSYADPLFAGPDPSTVNWREPEAFRHYLTCLRGQCSLLAASSFDEAVAKQKALLNTSSQVSKQFVSKGVRGDYRDFNGYFDVNLAAIAVLEHARGARLKKEWP